MEKTAATRSIYLAVLPFQVLADDPKAEIFCQGLVMDLITDLSRFNSFRIIAYDAIKEFLPDEAPGSPELDQLQLDYLVKGMVRRKRDRLVLNLQLINVRENRLVWAEKFSGGFDELFHIHEDIIEKIVVSLQHFVDYDLLNKIRKKPLTSMNAYECWLRGFQELKKGTLEADEQARVYFRKAIELDPHYPRAYTGMSLSFFNEWSCQLWNRWEVSKNGAFEWAKKALELDEWDHVSNTILGRIYLFGEAYEKAEHFLRKALRINPNDAETLVLIAISFVYLGYLKEAKGLYERARRLNPSDNNLAIACGAIIHFEMGAVDEAIALVERYEISYRWVDLPAFMAAACFLKGDQKKMQEYWSAYLDEFSKKINSGKPADTQTALEWMINVNPFRGETRLKPFWEYLSKVDPGALLVEKPARLHRTVNSFVREGDWWVVSYGGAKAQLSDLKGCHDIARLLAQPYQAIHCAELMGAKVVEKGEAVFDEKAKKTYQKRILQLQEAMEEAGTFYQDDRLASLEEEYDQLIEHLSRSVGKGGRIRNVAGTVEKCRTAVTWRIRSAIRKIAEAHPALGRHLEVSVKTGVFCEYAPEHEVEWIL